MTRWLIVVLLSLLLCASTFAQTTANSATQTSICEILKDPEQFERKLVQVRAQIWTDLQRFWLNDSTASPLQFGKVCRWLPAEFTHPTSLAGSTAFGTFTGRLIRDSTSSGRMILSIE